MTRGSAILLSVALGGLLAGCASQPKGPSAQEPMEPAATSPKSARPAEPAAAQTAPAVVNHPGTAALAYAQEVLGVRYRYGGTSRDEGFDCSGLVYYAYNRAGVEVPRTSTAQRRHVRPVSKAALREGDLVFFQLPNKTSHVGLYAGDGRFIHAPSSGKHVRFSELDNPYWRRHLYGGGRPY